MDLINRLKLPQPAAYEPGFSLRKDGIFWTVLDRGWPIAFVVRDVGVGGALLEVLKFRPGDKGRSAALPPYAFHYTTRRGYGASFNWSVDSMFQSPDRDSLEVTEQSPKRLAFLHAGEFNDGSKIAARLAITYDPATGQYAYDLTWDIDSTRDCGGEFSNIFHASLMHTEMSRREYDYGCFVRQGGSWEKYPITIMVTGLTQGRLTGIPVELGGGVGHINRNGIAPLIVHRVSNVPLHTGSCNSCFDLHQYAKVSAGKRANIESRFVDAGPVIAANPHELKPIEIEDRQAYAIQPGEVCDFESTIHSSRPWSGGIWRFKPGVQAAVVDGGVRGSRHCLQVIADSPEPVDLVPYGPAFTFDNHCDYEVSAWVKLEGDPKARAAIELNAFLFVERNLYAAGTASIIGPHDWTRLVARVSSGTVDNGYLHLKVWGPGKAWFDDILVRKVDQLTS